MPTYEITDNQTGKKYHVTGDSPPSEQEAAKIFADMGGTGSAKTKSPQQSVIDEMGTGKKMLTGIGAGMYDVYKGAQQLGAIGLSKLGLVSPETVQRITKEGQEARESFAPLREQSTAAKLGEFTGKIAPFVAMPGGVAGGALRRIGTSALSGGAMGAAEFVPEGESRLSNVGMGALGGGLVAGGLTGYKAAKQALLGSKVPEKLYSSALKQGTALSPEQRAANVAIGLEGGYLPSKKGLDKLYSDISFINNEIGTKINQSSAGGKTVSVDSIISKLDDVKQRAIDSFGDNNSVLNSIDSFAQSLINHPAVKDGKIPIDVAQKMKVNTYKQLKNAYGELKGFEVEAKKAMARGAKEEIVSAVPELAELNAKDSSLINLERVLFKAVNRIENRDIVGIGVPIKTIAGGLGGIKGAAVGTLAGIIDTPSIKSHIALALKKARGKIAAPKEVNEIAQRIIRNIGAQSAQPSPMTSMKQQLLTTGD